MRSWRDQILKEFTPKVARLTLVADPDGLLLEEGILEGVRERGFELIPFEDHIAFRYAYESKFRSHLRHGLDDDLVMLREDHRKKPKRNKLGDSGTVLSTQYSVKVSC